MSELITKKGFEQLKEDVRNVEEEILDVQREMGESVKRDNDLRENSEYMDLRVKAMYSLPAKKEELLNRLKSCIIIEDTAQYQSFDGKKVIVGSKVTYEFDGEEETLSIVGDREGNIDEGLISCKARFAKALISKHIGEKFKFNDSTIVVKEIKRIE